MTQTALQTHESLGISSESPHESYTVKNIAGLDPLVTTRAVQMVIYSLDKIWKENCAGI